MANQLLATFYVQAPEFLFEDITVAAEVQYQSGSYWYQNSSELTVTVTNAHYNDPSNGNNLRRRYKIGVFRVETVMYTYDYATGTTVEYPYYPLYKAGTYKRRLSIKFNNVEVLERMIYLTIQPDMTVSVGETPLIATSRTNTTSNPANHTVTVNVVNTAPALAARKILLNKANEYKGTVFIKSNIPVDSYGDDLTVETSSDYGSSNTWLQLADKIWLTRKIGTGSTGTGNIGNSEHKWSTSSYSPCILQDMQRV